MSAECTRHEETLVELARHDLPVGAGERSAALAHAAGCPRCSARIEDERRLTACLDRLAQEDAARGAPPRVERRLLAELRATRRGSRRRRRAAAVLAAAAIAVAALVRWQEGAPGSELAPAPVAAFVPIAWTEPLAAGEPGQLVTAALDRSALVALGVPAAEALGERDAMLVDLVVGRDGVARAFRLARVAELRQGVGGRR